MTAFVDWPVLPRKSSEDGPEPSTRAQYTQAIEDLHGQLQRSRRRYRRVLTAIVIAIVAVLLLGSRTGPSLGEGRVADLHQNIVAGLGVVLLLTFVSRSDSKDRIKRQIGIAQRVIDLLEEDREHEEVAEETVDLDSLLKANRNQLKTYHTISTDQAQEAFKMAKLVVGAAAVVFLFGCLLALRGETVIGVSLAGAAVLASGVGGWVARTFLESYRISVSQAEAYFREPMVQSYLLAAHQIAQKMETPAARDEGLSRVMDGFVAAGLECARSRISIAPGTHGEA